MCKSFLKLGKESQAISYDAMTSHVAIVFTRYMMLALEQRRNLDGRSFGGMYYEAYDELQDLHYSNALMLILKEFIDSVKKRMLLMEKELDDMLESFIENLSNLWNRCLKHCA